MISVLCLSFNSTMSIDIQKQIRANSQSAQAYFEDLNDWVKVMKDEKPKISSSTRETDSQPETTVQNSKIPLPPTEPVSTAPPPVRVVPVRQARCDSDLEIATRKKEEGNSHVKGGRWKEALEAYEAALRYVEPGNFSLKSIILSNRALCHLKLSAYQAALADSQAGTLADAGNSKSLFRQGLANVKLGRFEEALEAFRACQRISQDDEVDLEIVKVSRTLEKDKEKRREAARRMMTDPSREPKLPLFDLEISFPEKPKVQVKSEPRVYVPRSARVARNLEISSLAEFERSWREKANRAEIIKNLEISIFKENIEFDTFWEIVECACSDLEISSACEVLEKLLKLRRFTILVSLLGSAEKKILGKFFSQTDRQDLQSYYFQV